jgi:cephalosporin hydroxylase
MSQPLSVSIDYATATVTADWGERTTTSPLASEEGFRLVSQAWVRAGWDTKYMYSFSWLGRPIIQMPEDMLRIQELIYSLKPDVIVETGVAHGGSLVFYAGLFAAMRRAGRVIGVDIEIRPHNRRALEAHELFDMIELVEGSSIDPAVVQQVKKRVPEGSRVLVILDSCHAKQHVLEELRLYSPLVSPGSYLVVADGIMADLVGAPRTQEDWGWNNPREAVAEFLRERTDFVLDVPAKPFNEGMIVEHVTHWPHGWLRRLAE